MGWYDSFSNTLIAEKNRIEKKNWSKEGEISKLVGYSDKDRKYALDNIEFLVFPYRINVNSIPTDKEKLKESHKKTRKDVERLEKALIRVWCASNGSDSLYNVQHTKQSPEDNDWTIIKEWMDWVIKIKNIKN
jgi:hypothetical protein